jgi:Protein of unknown function (DUF1524)/Excalibur calcium-binding domain
VASWRPVWDWSTRHPKISAPVAGVLLLLVVVGTVSGGKDSKAAAGRGAAPASAPASSVASAPPSVPAATTVRTTSAAAPAPRISQARADRVQAGRRSALTLLRSATVKGRAPKSGYTRGQFGSPWTDDNDSPGGHNGCDTRNDILRRDLTGVVVKPGTNGCAVLSGTLHDPYTARTLRYVRGEGTPTAIQIDHVVALSDAWQTGAQQWDVAERVALANDPLNLLAVNGPTNEAKGDGDAATWLPPNKSYRCAYVARQVAVKARYHLWVTNAERGAMTRVLSTCPGEKAPTEAGPSRRLASAPAAPTSASRRASSAPQPTPRTTAAPAPPAAKVYANCDALNQDYPHGVGRAGARDHTSGSHPVTDFTVNTAVYDANTGRDRDGDGIACEHA